MRVVAVALVVLVTGCARAPTPSSQGAGAGGSATPNGGGNANESAGAGGGADGAGGLASSGSAAPPVDAAPPQIDPDGDDDPPPATTATLPADAHFTRVGKAPLSLWRICDLTPFAGALYAAHATAPLGADGATITRYDPDDEKQPFRVAFDWNRPGEPVQGGGAGQGFLRVHAIGERLVVTDADPPYAGFGVVDHGTEGYVFLSDESGAFAPARAPGHRPPATAAIIPRAYHVLDAIRWRGRHWAATGSVPPDARAWSGPSPGALNVANEDLTRFAYAVSYPDPWPGGDVWRLGYLVRFKDRLYAGIQDYEGRDPNDFVYVDASADPAGLRAKDIHPVQVSGSPGTSTLRWFADGGRLYWIALQHDGAGVLRVTDDGDAWREIALPPDGGRPTDIARFGASLVVLTERRLYRLDGDTPVAVADLAKDTKSSPFAIKDIFCVAPLAVYRDALFAGGQTDGALYRLD